MTHFPRPAVAFALFAASSAPAWSEKPHRLTDIPLEQLMCLSKPDNEKTACLERLKARTPHWKILTSKDEITDERMAIMSVGGRAFYKGSFSDADLSVICKAGTLFTFLSVPGHWPSGRHEVVYRIDGGEVVSARWRAIPSGSGLLFDGARLPEAIWDIGEITLRAFPPVGEPVSVTFDAKGFGRESAWLKELCPQLPDAP